MLAPAVTLLEESTSLLATLNELYPDWSTGAAHVRDGRGEIVGALLLTRTASACACVSFHRWPCRVGCACVRGGDCKPDAVVT